MKHTKQAGVDRVAEPSWRKWTHLAAVVSLLAVSTSLGPLQAGGVHQGLPPTELRGAHKVDVQMPTNQPELHGLVRYDTSAKKVVLQWRSRFQGQMITLDDQTESTSYWPTEVAPFGPNRLLVAGKDPIRHSTVIELWTFNEFQELPVPELDSESGKLKRPVIRQRVNRQPVYDAAVVGRDMVRVLFYNRGDGSALCQFHDSRDLYSLDTATGALEKILSANPDPQQPEVEVVPRLGDDYADRRCAKHLQYGYIYTLGYPANYTDDPSLYLFDLDLDGEIDEVHVVDGPTWRSLGLGDGAQYVEYYY